MVSGGAGGSDTYWSISAHNAGHSVVHISFPGHRLHPGAKGERRQQSLDQLEANADKLGRVAKEIKKSVPRAPYIRKLILRNFYQFSEETEAMYAVVGTLRDSCRSQLQRIPGGTGWTIAAYILTHATPLAYVFVQQERKWYEWNVADNEWVCLGDAVLPEKKPGDCLVSYSAVGTRDINEHGIQAIENLFA